MSNLHLNVVPPLDQSFLPALRFAQAYEQALLYHGESETVELRLERPDGTVFAKSLEVLPVGMEPAKTWLYVERSVKSLLWQRGGNRLHVSGPTDLVERLQSEYSPRGKRAFDSNFMGQQLFQSAFEIIPCAVDALPAAREPELLLGGHLNGCRIGFDLGGSDRKCAAVIDGEVVFSEEIEWDPYFQKDPEYHRSGIQDSIQRAAQHLPRVDAIGGSAAGVYINNEVLAGSLFRGLSQKDFDRSIRNLFKGIQKQWQVPLAIVNDGEVTALAASLSGHSGGILGIAMGTSLAAGYVRPDGCLTPWLNELAFVPVDLRDNGPVDEWSGDHGCGVQYFSQQAVARLGPQAGIEMNRDEKFPDYLKRVQELMQSGDERSEKIYRTIGINLGYALAQWARYYSFENVLLLGRVLSGPGGERLQSSARRVLEIEAPGLAEGLGFIEVSERDKRHGQAIAAASLPPLN
ncbi:MAG: ROK family protein [Opitutales bacterium]|nr:ROK family protein [Opitutales bacterium]